MLTSTSSNTFPVNKIIVWTACPACPTHMKRLTVQKGCTLLSWLNLCQFLLRTLLKQQSKTRKYPLCLQLYDMVNGHLIVKSYLFPTTVEGMTLQWLMVVLNGAGEWWYHEFLSTITWWTPQQPSWDEQNEIPCTKLLVVATTEC